jgi:hypothetical protein
LQACKKKLSFVRAPDNVLSEAAIARLDLALIHTFGNPSRGSGV